MSNTIAKLTVCVFLIAFQAKGNTSAAQPRITSLESAWGQQGRSFEVSVSGEGLSGECDFLFYETGLTCTQVSFAEDRLVAILEASTDCRLGLHAFQIRSNEGVSDVRVLRVLDRELAQEVEPNDERESAQEIQLQRSVVATLANEDSDCFQVMLDAGQRLSVEVEGIRLGNKLMDLKVAVFGPDGTTIAACDDTSLGKQDPYVSFVAAKPGAYVVQVDASGVEGSEESKYLMHVGQFIRPDVVFPPGGPVGQDVPVRLLGDTAKDWTAVAQFSELGTQDFYPAKDGLKAPTPIPFRVCDFGNVFDQEPNDQIDDRTLGATAAPELPMAFNGLLATDGDVDHFRFAVSDVTPIEFSAFAARIASPADTIIRVLSLDGKELCSNDDQSGLDSGLVWTPPEAGEFLLRVEEKRSAGGPRFVYRIEGRPIGPAVVAFLPRRLRDPSATSITVPIGNRVLEFVGVKRQRWFGKAEIELQGLPDSLTADFGLVDAEQYATPVVLEAKKDAAHSVELVRLSARSFLVSPTVEGGFEQPIDLVAASADRLYQGVRLDRLPVAIVDPAKVSVELEVPPGPIPRDSTVALNVHVERAAGFEGDVEIRITYLPEWMDGPEKITIPSGQVRGRYHLRSLPKIEDCTWPFVAEARAIPVKDQAEDAGEDTMRRRFIGRQRSARGDGEIEVASKITPVEIKSSPIQSAPRQWLGAQGAKLEVVFPIQRRGKSPDELVAVLAGLPAKVTADPVTLQANAGAARFNVDIPNDAPLGEFGSLVCELTGEFEGHQFTYRVGRNSVLKIVREDEVLTDETGRPLSPLEILRLQPVGIPSRNAADGSQNQN